MKIQSPKPRVVVVQIVKPIPISLLTSIETALEIRFPVGSLITSAAVLTASEGYFSLSADVQLRPDEAATFAIGSAS